MALWADPTTGVPYVNADGSLFDTDQATLEDCCCGPAGDCESLQEAIKERQQATGITTAWDSEDPTNTAKLIADWEDKSDYDLDEYKAYVNAIAEDYVDGTYTGGASEPTMLTATYANTATDCDELLALVQDMMCTTIDSASDTNEAEYQSVGWDADWDTAKSDATSTFPDYTNNDPVQDYRPGAHTAAWKNGGKYDTRSVALTCKIGVTDVPTAISHSADVYAMTVTAERLSVGAPPYPHTHTWDQQGYTGMTEDQWSKIAEVASGSWASHTTGELPGTTQPPNFVSQPADPEGRTKGFAYSNDTHTPFFVLTWDFTHTS